MSHIHQGVQAGFEGKEEEMVHAHAARKRSTPPFLVGITLWSATAIMVVGYSVSIIASSLGQPRSANFAQAEYMI
jgi:hypothetical protein